MLSKRHVLMGLAAVTLGACGASPEKMSAADETEALAAMIRSMRPDVDPDEAARAAALAFSFTRELAISYQITDRPLVHNTKVNMGLKPRGLCWHWAEDIQNRLNAEGFETLEVKRAISEGRGIRIDHSTAVITAKGDPFDLGVVLDPWRQGGVLFYETVAKDKRYQWEDRDVVLGRRLDLREAAG